MNVKVPIKVKSTNKTPLFSAASKSREEEGGSDTVRIRNEKEWEKSSVWEAWSEEKESFHRELYPEVVFLREGEIQKRTLSLD